MNFQNIVVISHTDIFKTQEEALCNNDTNLMLKNDYKYITAERKSFKTKKTAGIARTAVNLTWLKPFKKIHRF